MSHNLLKEMKYKNEQLTIKNIRKCNEYTSTFGLSLNDDDIKYLIESKNNVLIEIGRIEFGPGIMEKIIFAFCDSQYIIQDNYTETLLELQEIFYYFKNESLEEISDDELIDIMKSNFDGKCEGDLEYLQATVLENVCRDVRFKINRE